MKHGSPIKSPKRPSPIRRNLLPRGGARPPSPIDAVLAMPRVPPPAAQPGDLKPGPIFPPSAPTGPYQGAAGSEAQNPGQERVPPPDWANPSSANYERRNYYISPIDGSVVAREPGYYNPDNPWDTGRPRETNAEFKSYNIADYERRMSEPGVTPWGPGGKASPPGAFSAPASKGVQRAAKNPLLDSLVGGLSLRGAKPDLGANDPAKKLIAALLKLQLEVPGSYGVRGAA